MIDIIISVNPVLRYRFWLTTESDKEECANIQDQCIAIIFGWA